MTTNLAAAPAGGRARVGRAAMALALCAGLGAALAFPPFGAAPGILGFGLLMRLLDEHRDCGDAGAALIGWLAGSAYFLVSTWWVGEAFLVDLAAHGWQAPFAVLLLAGGLGLIWAVAAGVYRRIAPKGARRLLVFAAVFSVAEWIRGHLLTGFPWDLPGEVWRAGSATSQGASVIGAYGMTFLTLMIGAAPGLAVRLRSREGVLGLAAAVAMFAVLYAGGTLRLARAQSSPKTDAGPVIRVVQPDIPQTEKWSPEALQGIVQRYAALTAMPAARRPDVIVWPEGAVPLAVEDLLAPGSWTADTVLGALQPGQQLLFGSTRVGGTAGRPLYFNSLVGIRRTGSGAQWTGVYDKHHLVPFGEYMPMDRLAARIGLKALVHVGDGFTSGPRPLPLSIGGLGRVQPLICYESLFPSSFARTGPRPDWIANVSNDAWFGDTSGPWQHLNLASYRAIEEGLPMIRATPTGVSAVIDGYGRPLARLGVGKSGVLDAVLPGALAPTPYERWRDAPFALLCATGLACALRRWPAGRRLKG